MGRTNPFIVNSGYDGANRRGSAIHHGYPHISQKAWSGHDQPQSQVCEQLVIAHILAIELPNKPQTK